MYKTMVSEDRQPESADEVLVERVRQAEVRITAQATFLAAAYHRGAVLSGVLFAVVAALFGVAVTDWNDWSYPPLMAKVAIALTVALILVASSTALSAVSLPGAVDDFQRDVTKNALLLALLDSYRTAAKKNERRLTVSKYLFFVAFLCMAASVAGAGIVIRAQYIADTGARALAGDCWWELGDDEKAILRDEMRPRGGILDRIADAIGAGGANSPDGMTGLRVMRQSQSGSPAIGGAEDGGPIGKGRGTGEPIGRGAGAGTALGRGNPGRCTVSQAGITNPADPGATNPADPGRTNPADPGATNPR